LGQPCCPNPDIREHVDAVVTKDVQKVVGGEQLEDVAVQRGIGDVWEDFCSWVTSTENRLYVAGSVL
jgi:hypothetical protein